MEGTCDKCKSTDKFIAYDGDRLLCEDCYIEENPEPLVCCPLCGGLVGLECEC